MVVLYIILFIVFLSFLIMVHELGHLLTAKMFGVYCFEYAIGFGPKIFSFKRKKGETYFSLRAIPFGGFVSMYGEKETVPEELEGKIDPKRSLLAIRKWKRAIIMAAGVIMNFVLAILMFFIYEIAFPVYTPRYGHVNVANNSKAADIGLKSGDFFYSMVSANDSKEYVFYDNSALLTYADNSVENSYFGYCYTDVTFKDSSLYTLAHAYAIQEVDGIVDAYESQMNVQDVIEGRLEENKYYLVEGYLQTTASIASQEEHLALFISDKYGDELSNCIIFNIELNTVNKKNISSIPIGEKVAIVGKIAKDLTNGDTNYKQITILDNNYRYSYVDYSRGDLLSDNNDKIPTKLSFTATILDEENHQIIKSETFNDLQLSKNGSRYCLPADIGLSMTIEETPNDFSTALGNTFVDFGQGATLIVRSLGTLFTDASAWSEVGGIVAIGVSTTRTLEDFGFSRYLYFWALISVNLGIVNLLPFPGLDGWQLLVVAIEGIFKKEIPNKIKSIISFIGIAILFTLMIAILIKDVVGLFI